MAYYRRNRVYTSSVGQSTLMREVMPETVNLRRNLRPYFGKKQIGINRTAFKEIRIMPPNRVWPSAVRSLADGKIRRKQVNAGEFSRIMLKAMKAAIAERWDSQKFHVVQHSSGWDSRLISTALVELRKDRGDGWVGDVLFVEVSGEPGPFRKIMKAQMWLPSQYAVYNPGSKPQEYHALSFEFSDAWRKLNGYCSYPVNINWDPFDWLQQRDRIPSAERVQILTGYGANEIGNFVGHGKGFKRYLNFIYYHSLSHFPLWGGEDAWIHPFYHLDYIRTFIKHSKGQPAYYRQLVVKSTGPRWAGIPRVEKAAKRKLGYRTVSRRILARCVADYKLSWLGREVFPDVKPTADINYYDWWGYWSLASFCDYLRARGVEVRVE